MYVSFIRLYPSYRFLRAIIERINVFWLKMGKKNKYSKSLLFNFWQGKKEKKDIQIIVRSELY